MKKVLSILIFLISCLNVAFGQLNYTINSGASSIKSEVAQNGKSEEYDKKILKYYTVEQLEEIKSIDPDKIKSIEYFYVKSYTHSPFDCEDCDFKKFMETFDVSQYEHLRHKTEPIVFNYLKTDYQVILIPLNQLEYLTALQKYKLEN